MKKLYTLFVLLLCAFSTFATVVLPKIFGDNMVLQRNKPIKIWGWANPGEKITVKFNKQTKYTSANNNGKWLISLGAEKAGGPYFLNVKGENTILLSNILVGEVWLCSGQSNMSMPIAGWGKINNYQSEISKANYPLIREFKVPNLVSDTLNEDFSSGNWEICTPKTAGDFSATAYFFARKLYNELKVPIGLVNSSWGGTQSEAWTSNDGFQSTPEFEKIGIDVKSVGLKNLIKSRYTNILSNLEKFDSTSNIKAITENWENLNFNDSNWGKMNLPGIWEDQGYQALDGVVWFRKIIDINNLDLNKPATIELAKIDDADETYINGIKIGQTDKWDSLRNYVIPVGILKNGKNVIAIKVTDTKGSGGIYGNPSEMKISINNQIIPLGGDWKFRIESLLNFNNSVGPNDYPSLLFNSMINPLLNFTIKGVIWYQGEANSGRSYQYRKAFPMLINDWRNQFKQGDFPFYYVQLSTFGSAESNSKNGSQWAELREAQDMTLALPNTGMVVTTDIGNPIDIHPKNKQDVGIRLAAIAMHNLYFKKGEFTGPRFKSMIKFGNQVTVTFTHANSGLMTKDKSNNVLGFEVAGVDKKFYPAKATISNNKIILKAGSVVEPIAVRYNWVDDASAGNLFNKELFPAAPFRTDNWKGITENNLYKY